MNKGLGALWEYRLLVANYEDKWSKNTTEHFIECADIIEKELKALEIIKEKSVVIPRLFTWRGVEDYNLPLLAKYQLTKEEYDLLKEMLE